MKLKGWFNVPFALHLIISLIMHNLTYVRYEIVRFERESIWEEG